MRFFTLFTLLVFVISCKQQTPKEKKMIVEKAPMEASETVYPEALAKVFNAHGGLETWKKQRTLGFTLPKPNNPETHIVDLRTRDEHISAVTHSMGYDGKTWLLDVKGNYKGNPEFYHNLMFYFYAMPFVVADKGINYQQAEDLVVDGVRYPGIRISYDAGVGISPKDEYFLHYDAETYQMAWLGYTVTYRSGEISDNVKWISYHDWEAVSGLALPKAISWYTYEGREIKDKRNTVLFEERTLSEDAKPNGFYEKPEGAVYWEKPTE